MTVREWLEMATSRLKSLEVESPSLEAQILAAHMLRVERAWLFAHPEARTEPDAGLDLLSRRSSGEPLAYILGWREFFGRRFSVDPSVLIPRQETEVLLETALKIFPASIDPFGLSEFQVLDLGTGSGILAISLKLERPNWQIVASDISADALATASANAKFHKAQLSFLLSDGFEALLGQCFNLIVSNPPYIGRDEKLSREVSEFEPELALFAENDGLAFYEMLAATASNYLVDDGLLIVEVGYRQSDQVIALFESQRWSVYDKVYDLSGTMRVLCFRPEFGSVAQTQKTDGNGFE